MYYRFLKPLIIVLVLMPYLVLGALEQNYPSLPGGQTITVESSLAEVILYVVGLAILVSGIIALVSLIVGGIKYTSSAGRPEIMSDARNKINNSLLGILILVGSYLVLNTINPQLLVMRIEKVPLESSVVLLSEESRLGLIVGDIPGVPNQGREIIEYFVKNGKAFYLNYEIQNLKNLFGEFVITETTPNDPPEPTKVNFEHFKWKYIGFIEETEGSIKIITYEEPNLTGESHTYKYLGRLNENEEPIRSSVNTYNGIKVINLEFFNEDLLKGGIVFKDENGDPAIGNVSHSPLSIKIESENSGIYLYSNPTVEIKEQRYFTSSIRKLDSVNFNDKAGFIKIRNNPGNNDFLVILYEDENYSDSLRLFFQERVIDMEETFGNIPNDATEVPIGSTDEYGKAWRPSSVQVFKIEEENQSCNEVRLCTEPNLDGDCISYAPINTPFQANPRITRDTLPVYKPENLPDDFDDEIKSLKIDGNCLVVLFENRLEIPPQITGTVTYYWDSFNHDPGASSEIFLGAKTPIVSDLTENNPIGRCREAWDFLWLDTDPCASAIAIYPIK